MIEYREDLVIFYEKQLAEVDNKIIQLMREYRLMQLELEHYKNLLNEERLNEHKGDDV